MSEENNVEVSTENTIDWEARAMKAEAKIVDLKKSTKEVPEDIETEVEVKTEVETETKSFGEQDIEKILEKRDFYKNNPEMSEHKEAIEKYTANGGISLEQAKFLIIQGDPTITARQNTSNSNITNGMSGGGIKTYTQEALQKLPRNEKMQALKDISSGKAIETL